MAHFLNLNEFSQDYISDTYLNIAQITKIVVQEDSPGESYTIIIETSGGKAYTLAYLGQEQVEHLERLIGVKANIESY